MGKPKIDAMEALSLINAGVDNATLMKKFNLSVKGLHSLYDKLISEGLLDAYAQESSPGKNGALKTQEPGRELSAREVLRDIRAGKSDADLMEKYSLSAKGLDHLFMQLLGAGLISGNELHERCIEPDSTVDLKDSLLSSAILEGKENGATDEDMAPVEVEYEPPSWRQTTDIVDDYEKSVTVEPVQIKRDDRCPVCGKPLLDEEEEDEDGAENEDRDETEALVEDNITPMFESFKRQSEETMNLMKEKIEGGVDELKQESLTLMEDMLKATGKSIGGLSADIAGLREEMSSLKTRGSGFSIGNIFAIIMSLAAIVSVAAFYFMGEGPR